MTLKIIISSMTSRHDSIDAVSQLLGTAAIVPNGFGFSGMLKWNVSERPVPTSKVLQKNNERTRTPFWVWIPRCSYSSTQHDCHVCCRFRTSWRLLVCLSCVTLCLWAQCRITGSSSFSSSALWENPSPAVARTFRICSLTWSRIVSSVTCTE